MSEKSTRDLIVGTFEEKSCLKQDVFAHTQDVFKDFKTVIKSVANDLRSQMQDKDKRLKIEFSSNNAFEARLKFAGDVLIFHMHTNVFDFDKSHQMWKTSYVKDDRYRAFCGMITIYNFLSDSFKYNRMNDSGYMVARVFVNKDNHYFVEGKRQLGFLYNNFSTEEMNKEVMTKIVESAILYTLDFDLLTPPYNSVNEVSVYEMKELANNLSLKTGKRLGFRFESDGDIIS